LRNGIYFNFFYRRNIMGQLSNKVAVITGGNSGIGLATAKLFVDEGAKVAIFGRDQATLDRAVEVLGSKAIGVRGDVTSKDDLAKLYATVKRQWGGVDVIFANAGVAEFMPIDAVNDEHFYKQFDINVKGVMLTVQQALPVLNPGASIVLTTSGVNKIGLPMSSVYSANKAAVRSLARTLSSELLDRGVRVNAVSPGYTETPIFGRMGLSEEQIKGIAANALSDVPLKRMANPSEIAQAALFLASNASSYIVGAEIDVDGGQTQI
jgi:NAD(P)-dependent dehydrogenase (short-subunit alcohol dehydrogenase family)